MTIDRFIVLVQTINQIEGIDVSDKRKLLHDELIRELAAEYVLKLCENPLKVNKNLIAKQMKGIYNKLEMIIMESKILFYITENQEETLCRN